jgi:ankyrin repeat protein
VELGYISIYFLASRYGHIEVVKVLIANGAIIEAKNYFQYTLLIEGLFIGNK